MCGVFSSKKLRFGVASQKIIARKRAILTLPRSLRERPRDRARTSHGANNRIIGPRQIDQNPRFPPELLALAAGRSDVARYGTGVFKFVHGAM